MDDLRDKANKVRVALNLGIQMFDPILKALEAAKITSIYLIEEVEKDLKNLESLDAKLTAELESPNSALQRADVLEWVPGERSKGMIIRQFILMKKLGNTLGIEPNLETLRDTAYAMKFDLDSAPVFFGTIQRS